MCVPDHAAVAAPSAAAARAAPRPPWRGWGGLGLGVLAGTALQLQQVALGPAAVYLAALVTALFLGGLQAWRGRVQAAGPGRLWPLAGWVALAALAAWGGTGLRAVGRLNEALAPALEGPTLQLQGLVAELPQRSPWGWRFVFRVESAALDGRAVALPSELLLGWNPAGRPGLAPEPAAEADLEAGLASGGDLMAARTAGPVPGQRWRFSVRLKRAHGARNPLGFDHELWLWERGLLATGQVRSAAAEPAPRLLAQTGAFPVERLRLRVREAIRRQLRVGSDTAAARQAGVIVALVTGDQQAIERGDWRLFRDTGVAHLMSISGLHISLLAWLTARVTAWAWRQTARSPGRWGRACLRCPAPLLGRWAGLAVALAYSVFCGWGIPAQRTVGMLLLAGALQAGGRRWPWPTLWSLLLAVVLLMDPWACLQPGFWLSFVAVGILFATDRGPAAPTAQAPAPAWQRLWRASRLGPLLREQGVLGLALAPLSLLFFGQLSVIGLLANLLAVPWVTALVTPLALLGCLWAPLWGWAAGAMQLLFWLLQAMAGWPGATWSAPVAPFWVAGLGVLAGLLGAAPLPPLWRSLGLLGLVPVLTWQAPRPAHGRFELLAADVGQGQAVWLRTATHALLYDAGPRYAPGSDAGERVLVPLLRAHGEALDLLLLSHRDSDHTGGAEALLAAFPEAGLRASLGRAGAPAGLRADPLPCRAGQQWSWDGVAFTVLHPEAAEPRADARPNTLSCVLRVVDAQGHAALLTGDIEAAQERALLARGLDLRADWLLVPHHGSQTSSDEAFLRAVQPALAVVQAGYRNRFGHPAAAVQARYGQLGIPMVLTADCGAVGWSSERPRQWRCQRELDRRYWHWPLQQPRP